MSSTALPQVSVYFIFHFLFAVMDMKRMVQEMVTEVEAYEVETPASEELYSKLELKVRKKFNDEIDRLEKSFRRIMEQLEIQQ